MVMFDSLDKHLLSCYGCDWTHTPNFDRLAEKCTRFDKFYVGSMPCMPARRELHTGRYCMLHRDWGPLEPFDDSMPELLKQNGVYTHLCTDHYHYFQDGGATYHNRFSSWEGFRGQEGDAWKGDVKEPDYSHLLEAAYASRKAFQGQTLRQDEINRQYIRKEADMPQSKTFAAGLEFIEHNHSEDRWFLDIETFDPHEPFFCRGKWKELYPHVYHGGTYDWPQYKLADEDRETVEHVRMEYAALLSKCDDSLGKVLDAFDRYELWKDTMLIVCTDHGFLLGEHDWWGKSAPLYQEVANTPFFIYDPRMPNGGRCNCLAQTIDIAPTLLEFFGVKIPKDMQGKPLRQAYEQHKNLHETALYGVFGNNLCFTDGRYTFFRAPVDPGIQAQYTLMPTLMDDRMEPEVFKSAELAGPFSFTKGAKVLRISRKTNRKIRPMPYDLLFDIENDPGQTHNLKDYELRAKLCNRMRRAMKETDAPKDAYERYGLQKDVSADDLLRQEEKRCAFRRHGIFRELPFDDNAAEFFHATLSLLPAPAKMILSSGLRKACKGKSAVSIWDVDAYLQSLSGPMKPLSYSSRMTIGYFLQDN